MEAVKTKTPKTKPASAGGPPRPPKKTARGFDEPSPEGRHIRIPAPVILKELAAALGQSPLKIVANAMELGRFSFPGNELDFDFAATIAKRHGFEHAMPKPAPALSSGR